MRAVCAALALAALPAASARPLSQAEASLEVRAVRFYRGVSGETLVDAFCSVPVALFERLSQPGESGGVYRVSVTVRDSGGLPLHTETWSQRVPEWALGVTGGSTGEHFTFAAPPGRYTVEVAVTDSATGLVSRERADFRAYASVPAASDLLLANAMRPAEGDEAPQAGEIRKGGLLLRASGRPVLTPQEARLGYYLEVYPERPETLVVTLRVRSESGAQVVATEGQRVPFEGGGGVTRGMVDLAGLPPGGYELELAIAGKDSTVTRTAPFGMTGFETQAAIVAAAPAEDDVFAGKTEAQLDTMYEPLILLMSSDEQGIYPTLSLVGKRRFLRQFWVKRDVTPGTVRNEAREDFYARIHEANRRFRERGAGEIPGWRTDRGRIFIKYGPADEVLSRPQAGNTAPYEVWKYTRGRPLKYVFLDQTGFGNYALIWTDDRREPSRPNWQALLGPEAVLDVERF